MGGVSRFAEDGAETSPGAPWERLCIVREPGHGGAGESRLVLHAEIPSGDVGKLINRAWSDSPTCLPRGTSATRRLVSTPADGCSFPTPRVTPPLRSQS